MKGPNYALSDGGKRHRPQSLMKGSLAISRAPTPQPAGRRDARTSTMCALAKARALAMAPTCSERMSSILVVPIERAYSLIASSSGAKMVYCLPSSPSLPSSPAAAMIDVMTWQSPLPASWP